MKDFYSTVSHGTPDSLMMKRYILNKKKRQALAEKIRSGSATETEKKEFLTLVDEQFALSKKIVQE